MGMGKSAIFDIYKKNMRNFAGFLAFLFLANLGFMGFGGGKSVGCICADTFCCGRKI